MIKEEPAMDRLCETMLEVRNLEVLANIPYTMRDPKMGIYLIRYRHWNLRR